MRKYVPFLLSALFVAGCSTKPVPYVIRHNPSPVAFGVFNAHPPAGPRTVSTVAVVGVTRTPEMPAIKQDQPPASFILPKATTTSATETPGAEFGTPVPGKPGFFKSPHGSKGAIVDARGFEPGSEVRDPESGKTFLIPAN